MGVEKMEAPFENGQNPRRGCSAVYGWMEIMNRLLPQSNLFESPYLVQMAKTSAILFRSNGSHSDFVSKLRKYCLT